MCARSRAIHKKVMLVASVVPKRSVVLHSFPRLTYVRRSNVLQLKG